MTDYRNPKVTETSNSMGKWIAIAVAVLLAIAAIAWLMGAFNGEEADSVPVVTEQEAPAVTTTPAPTATEQEAPATPPEPTATETTAPAVAPAPENDPAATEPPPIAPVAQ